MAERDLAQQTLADRLGRSKGYVSEHINGTRPVDSDLVAAVAEAIGEPTEDLIDEITRRMRRTG